MVADTTTYVHLQINAVISISEDRKNLLGYEKSPT
jgi:hypothetical protein